MRPSSNLLPTAPLGILPYSRFACFRPTLRLVCRETMPAQGQRRWVGGNRWVGSQVSQVLRMGREEREKDGPFLKLSEKIWVGSGGDKYKDHKGHSACVVQVLSYQGEQICATGAALSLSTPIGDSAN